MDGNRRPCNDIAMETCVLGDISPRCVLCGEGRWDTFPNPAARQSVTTAGLVIPEPLAKAQCRACGLVQRIGLGFVGDSDFYQKRYKNYYERAGANLYDLPRYQRIAEWIASAAGVNFPSTILDVGCGAGWLMKAIRPIYAGAVIAGIDPSEDNAEAARRDGLDVETGKIGDGKARDRRYDLIYCNNVLQHVLDPLAFLAEVRSLLTERGRLALLCPDATVPSNELLWADHNFSCEPRHLFSAAVRAGMGVVDWRPNPPHHSLLDKQLIVLRRDPDKGVAQPAPLPAGDQFKARFDYLRSWDQVQVRLRDAARNCRRMFNFGASTWTWTLAAYCPEWWRTVDCCLVDKFSGSCLGKSVAPVEDIRLDGEDAVVLGVHPASQSGLASRFGAVCRTIRWDDLISR